MNTAIILQILTGLAGIISLWLKEYYSEENKTARKKENEDEEIQKGRNDIESGNVDGVSARIDKLLTEENNRITGLKNSGSKTR